MLSATSYAPSAFCSCSSCRHATDQLAASFAGLLLDPAIFERDLPALSSYATFNHQDRYFCPDCGVNAFNFDRADGQWLVCTGMLHRTEGLFERKQIFMGDTRDGGQSVWMGGVGRKFQAGSDSQLVKLDSFGPPQVHDPSEPPTRLHGSCHCKGVTFEILPYPDQERYKAELCTCTSAEP